MKIEAEEDVSQYISELLSNFAYRINEEEREISIEPLQINTKDLRNNISAFVNNHKQTVPQLNQLASFVNKLKDGEYFYIFPNVELDTIQIAELGNRLQALNEGTNIEHIQEEFSSIFGDLLNNYNMFSFNGESKAYIGESDKSKITCRFCKKKSPEVTFRKKAHAISEALGNKGIVCREECDTCNAEFGEGIETDLIAFLSLHRAFFGIKGKGSGAPKLKGSNFSIMKDSAGTVNFKVIGEETEFPERIEVCTYEEVVLQNIYRALCKYIISVIDAEYLPNLQSCISWIKQNHSTEKLPSIRMKLINELYSDFPSLSVFIRKNTDTELPHVVGEFRFANIVIVFVLPFSEKDTLMFIDGTEFEKFWSLSQYSKHSSKIEWQVIELNSNEKKKLQFNVNFEQRV